jgi:hypothetical protein
LYVAGIEHSGTTLLSQLLASQSVVLALGEVGQFLSREHMQNYLARWGEYDDVTRCSCGADWSKCPIWKNFSDLNGRFGNDGIAEGYRLMLERLMELPGTPVIVDSSKTFSHLAELASAWKALGLSPDGLLVLVIAKDPRGFASSIGRKAGGSRSLLSHVRSMNWWTSVYSKWLGQSGLPNPAMKFITYEQLCLNTKSVISSIGRALGCDFEQGIDVAHSRSHIALGNKDFIERNRSSIAYDDGWKGEWRVQAAWMLNSSARSVFQKIERESPI